MVSLSTTLATNAIVEGQGAEVGLILIGFESGREVPTTHRISIGGGCTIKGDIREEVDLPAARRYIESMKGTVESFAVSGYMSVRNPVQERAVEELVHERTGCPVVCAHELSGDLGMYERTVTSVLNARLIPLVTHLIEAVRTSLDSRGIEAPIMVVKGDGSLIGEETAMQRPVETVLSGPAASVLGGVVLSGRKSGIIVDMGGTTTDIAVVKDGRPCIQEEGAEVGGWLTRVKAAEITTIGLGGDSFIQVTRDRRLKIGPQKVFPLCWIASSFPYLLDELESIEQAGYHPLNSQPTSIFVYIKDPSGLELTATEKRILELIRAEPHSLYWIAKSLKKDPDIIGWERLVTIGSIHRANLTPTDILHVQGSFVQWEGRASETGLRIMAKRCGTSTVRIMEMFFRQFSLALFGLIVDKMTNSDENRGGSSKSGPLHYLTESPGGRYVLEHLFDDAEHGASRDLLFSVKLTPPVIAVGAPASAYFPDVVRRLDTELLVPDSAEVANAVGTVNGKVEERVRVLIKPGETGGYFVYTPEERKIFRILENAVEYGERTGRLLAERRAELSGARRIELRVERHDRYATLSDGGALEGNPQDRGASPAAVVGEAPSAAFLSPADTVSDGQGGAAPPPGEGALYELSADDTEIADDRIFIESVLEILASGSPW
jgi:N-methylhydantoinase A/oxoprolinase/acetone carboxylase beta subunit